MLFLFNCIVVLGLAWAALRIAYFISKLAVVFMAINQVFG